MNDTQPVYLNTASCGLLDAQTLEDTTTLYNAMISNSSGAVEALRDHGLQRIRHTTADFLNAPPGNIAFIPNFSYGLNAIVQALKGTERVMLYRNDYPSVLEPFRINKFDISWIEAGNGFDIDIEDLKIALLTHKIEILAISHVQWMSGYKLDLHDVGEFCARHNIVFIVDATQSLGAMPIFPRELKIDVLLASNYKWMNAGFGTGIMYMNDAFLQRYPPVIGGNNSYVIVGNEWEYTPSVKCYEPGHLNFHGLLILEAAINKKMKIGISNIWEQNMQLTNKLANGLKAAGFTLLGSVEMTNRSSIVLIKAKDDLQQYLQENNIVVIYRNGFIRISIHYHNTENDIQNILNVMANYNG